MSAFTDRMFAVAQQGRLRLKLRRIIRLSHTYDPLIAARFPVWIRQCLVSGLGFRMPRFGMFWLVKALMIVMLNSFGAFFELDIYAHASYRWLFDLLLKWLLYIIFFIGYEHCSNKKNILWNVSAPYAPFFVAAMQAIFVKWYGKMLHALARSRSICHATCMSAADSN